MPADLLGLVATRFPAGVVHYAAGGVLVGLGVALVYLGTGIAAGVSTSLETTLSFVSGRPRFHRREFLASRGWRVLFVVGIVLGGLAYTLGVGEGRFTTAVQPWRLFGGGILVGVGTRLGKGCTSGHGVCGVGSGSRTSLLAVAAFLTVAIATAQLVAAVGVGP